MTNKSILIFSNSKIAIDLDLKIPIALGFRNKGYSVTFFLMNIYSFEESFTKKLELIASDKNFNIIYKDDLYSFRSFTDIYKSYKQVSTFYLDKIIRRILQIHVYILNTLFFNKYSDSISEICSSNKIIIASNYPGIPKDKLEACFYNKSRISNALFIGTPLVVWPHWYQKIIFPFDLFLTSSETEYDEIVKLNIHPNVKFLGCPSLDSDYLFNINTQNLKSDSKVILLIMVNPQNPIYQNFPIFDEVKKLIDDLLSNGFEILLKPHPSDSNDGMYLMPRTGSEFIKISNDPIEILVCKVDFVITLLSTSILKTIALNKPSFLFIPETLLMAIRKNDDYFASVYFTNSTLSKTWIDEFCNRFSNVNELLLILSNTSNYLKQNENFLNNFKPLNSTKRIINYLEDLLP